jgi:hypothetical protein
MGGRCQVGKDTEVVTGPAAVDGLIEHELAVTVASSGPCGPERIMVELAR